MRNGNLKVLGKSVAETNIADFCDLGAMRDWELAALNACQSSGEDLRLDEVFGDEFADCFLRHKNRILAEAALRVAEGCSDTTPGDIAACRESILNPRNELPEPVMRILLFNIEEVFGSNKRRQRAHSGQMS